MIARRSFMWLAAGVLAVAVRPTRGAVYTTKHPLVGELEARLDGASLDLCVEACPSEGWAVVLVRDASGCIKIDRDRHGVVTRRVRGRVEVLHKGRSLP